MQRFRLLIGLALIVASLGFGSGQAAAQPDCGYALGFATLHAMIPNIVGSCTTGEVWDPFSQASRQGTTGGLLVWRKLDNWTAFTDGYHTWVNGPNGLQERLNTERYCWEGDAGKPLGAGMCEVAAIPQPFSSLDIGHLPPMQRTILELLYPTWQIREYVWSDEAGAAFPTVDPYQIGPLQTDLIRRGYVVESIDSIGRTYVQLAPGVAQAITDYRLTIGIALGLTGGG